MRRFLAFISGVLSMVSCSLHSAKLPPTSAPQPVSQSPSRTPQSTGLPPAPAPAQISPSAIPVPTLEARLEPENDGEKKLDGNLLRVERASKRGTQEAEAAAKSLSLLDDGNRIKIDVALNDKSNVPAFRQAVGALGGQVIVALENHVFALIPPAAIVTLAARGDVFAIATASANVRQ